MAPKLPQFPRLEPSQCALPGGGPFSAIFNRLPGNGARPGLVARASGAFARTSPSPQDPTEVLLCELWYNLMVSRVKPCPFHTHPAQKKGDVAAALVRTLSQRPLGKPLRSRRRRVVVQRVRNAIQHLFRADLPELVSRDIPVAKNVFGQGAAGFGQMLFDQTLQNADPVR